MGFWAKFLARVWGRGIFYMFCAVFQFGQGTFFGGVAGLALLIAAAASFITSAWLSKKLNTLSNQLLEAYSSQMSDFQHKDEALQKEKEDYVRAIFNKMDADG